MYDGRESNPQDACIRQGLNLLCTPFHHRRMFHVKQKSHPIYLRLDGSITF